MGRAKELSDVALLYDATITTSENCPACPARSACLTVSASIVKRQLLGATPAQPQSSY